MMVQSNKDSTNFFTKFINKFNDAFNNHPNLIGSLESSEEDHVCVLSGPGLYFRHCDLLISFDDIDLPLHEFVGSSPHLMINSYDEAWLASQIPLYFPEYVKRVYIDMGYALIDNSLPTEFQMLQQNKEIDTICQDDDFDQDGHYSDELADFDHQIDNGQIYSDIEDKFDEDFDAYNIPFNFFEPQDDDVPDMSDYDSTDRFIDEEFETVSGPLIESVTSSDDIVKIDSADLIDSDIIMKDVDQIRSSNANIRNSNDSLGHKQKFQRSGPKKRGPQRCNQNFKRTWRKKSDRLDDVALHTLSSLREKKRSDKLKTGRVWKGNTNRTRSVINNDIIEKAFALEKDKEIANRIAKKEQADYDYECLMDPDPRDDCYGNYHKERDFYLSQKKIENENFKKKEYSINEVSVNKYLKSIITDFSTTDHFSYSRTSSIVDDLNKVELFIKSNVTDDLAIKKITGALIDAVDLKPTLIDKCSKFLQELILKVKPVAFGVDVVRDISLNVDVLKEEHEVCFGKPIDFSELAYDCNVLNPDLRDDHARRGEIIHNDPLLRHFNMKKINRNGILSEQVDYNGVLSCELLFQLLSPSVCIMNASDVTVMSKMQSIASNIHTINLPKFSLFQYGTDIIQDTLVAARAIFLTRRRLNHVLGFPLAPV
jgi:hypothetical protein